MSDAPDYGPADSPPSPDSPPAPELTEAQKRERNKTARKRGKPEPFPETPPGKPGRKPAEAAKAPEPAEAAKATAGQSAAAVLAAKPKATAEEIETARTVTLNLVGQILGLTEAIALGHVVEAEDLTRVSAESDPVGVQKASLLLSLDACALKRGWYEGGGLPELALAVSVIGYMGVIGVGAYQRYKGGVPAPGPQAPRAQPKAPAPPQTEAQTVRPPAPAPAEPDMDVSGG